MMKKLTTHTQMLHTIVTIVALVLAPNAFAGGDSWDSEKSAGGGGGASVGYGQGEPTILVSVPSNGKSVTYTMNGRQWTVRPGQSTVIPVGATQIGLTPNTVVTLSYPPAPGGIPASTSSYVVPTSTTMPDMSTDTLVANSSSFQPMDDTGTLTMLETEGGSFPDLISLGGAGEKGGSGFEQTASPEPELIEPMIPVDENPLPPNEFDVLTNDVTDGNAPGGV